jgi:hypothetical protein
MDSHNRVLTETFRSIIPPNFNEMGNQGRFKELSSQLRTVSGGIDSSCQALRSLPTLGVDADAVRYGLHSADILAEWRDLWRDRAAFAEAINRWRTDYDAGAAFLEAFMRSYLGESPQSIMRDAKSTQQRLIAVNEAWDKKHNDVTARLLKLQSEEASLRATLTQRYGVQF